MQNRHVLRVGSFLLLMAGAALGQKPAFDVASVRPSAPLDMARLAADMQAGKMPRFGARIDGSRAEYTYMSLKDLIAAAYKVKAYQITGPDWLAGQRFDIVAKLPDSATREDVPAMLQALLAERFKLTAHRETQEHPVLGLVVAKGGPKLMVSPEAGAPIDEEAPLKTGEMKMDTPNGQARVTRNSDGSSTVNMGAKGTFTQKMDGRMLHMQASTITMAGFADMLTSMLQMGGGGGRQVVDMTGIQGNYQVAVDLSMADLMANARAQGMEIQAPRPGAGGADSSAVADASEPDGGSTIYSSVEKLGLKLEPRKAQVEQIVIDHIEKVATDN